MKEKSVAQLLTGERVAARAEADRMTHEKAATKRTDADK